MRILKRIWVHLLVLSKSRENRWDLPGWLIRRPLIAAANGLYETALLLSGRAPTELKLLAGIKAAMLTHCEFCIDISDTLGRHEGFSEEKLIALVNYRDSDQFTHLEKLNRPRFSAAAIRVDALGRGRCSGRARTRLG